MSLHLTWPELLLRLTCTLIAAAIIGYDRGERGKSAGLRTTILVSLAASVAMLQVNDLLALAGRPSDSFVMNDLMRLPLGILTGVGFIGAGAILRRGELVVGVTTAATLWYVTVIGLCFGGGQIGLGWIATAAGVFVLLGLNWIENRMTKIHHARLIIMLDESGPAEDDIRRLLGDNAITTLNTDFAMNGQRRTYTFEVRESVSSSVTNVPSVVENLSRQAGVVVLRWRRSN
jgi:putative Mg2+ transporter-C (MgtC) family protein